MALSPDVQRMFDGRLVELEADARRLLRDIRAELGGEHRAAVTVVGAKVDVALTGIEDLIYRAQDADESGSLIEKIHQDSDQLIVIRAQMDRTRRSLRREQETLALDRRETRARQVVDELDAELGRLDDLQV